MGRLLCRWLVTAAIGGGLSTNKGWRSDCSLCGERYGVLPQSLAAAG